MNTAGNAHCASESFAMPPLLTSSEAPGQEHAQVPGGIHSGPKVGPQAETPNVFGPRLHASQNRAGAGEASGSAQRAQESPTLHAGPDRAGKAGNTSLARGAQEGQVQPELDHAMLEVQDKFQSAGSAPAHLQNRRMCAEQESMKVLPAAWQHQVPDAFEAQFADGQAQHPRSAAASDEPPANAQRPPRKTPLAGGARMHMQHL